jgi:hypothetical protein
MSFSQPVFSSIEFEGIQYENRVYNSNIHTVLLHKKNAPLSEPVVFLNDTEPLVLQFDDLERELKNYTYTFIHCNYDWKPSGLFPMEYIQGIQENQINGYEYSRNPLQKYVHYRLEFPNEDFTFTKSGNYLLVVYEDWDKSKLVLTRRFYVSEQKGLVSANIHASSNVDERFSHQEVDVQVHLKDFSLVNPYDNIHLTILQNQNPKNAVENLKPMFVNGNILNFDYSGPNIFEGGNEFRNFDITSLRVKSLNIDKIELTTDSNFVYLKPDKRRTFLSYLQREDINGKYVIRSIDNAWNSETDADYAKVHFMLPVQYPFMKGKLYIYGAISNWNFTDEYAMIYNPYIKTYEKWLYVKQGYYDYQYIYLPENSNTAEIGTIEGNHVETENEYRVLVYYTDPNLKYDRILCSEVFNSRN